MDGNTGTYQYNMQSTQILKFSIKQNTALLTASTDQLHLRQTREESYWLEDWCNIIDPCGLR